jgi:NAD(P)H-dependent FMN reductase
MVRVLAQPSRLARVDAALREMFDALAAQPIPSRLLSVADQLDDQGEAEPKPRRRKDKQA